MNGEQPRQQQPQAGRRSEAGGPEGDRLHPAMERRYFQGQGGAGPMPHLPDAPPLCTVTRGTSLLADT